MKLPPDVYRTLHVLKVEGVVTYTGLASVLDIEDFAAARLLNALTAFGWVDEQILFDYSSEFSISPTGREVLDEAPPTVSKEGYTVVPPPTFKESKHEQPPLFDIDEWEHSGFKKPNRRK
jgi:hypothetical protein